VRKRKEVRSQNSGARIRQYIVSSIELRKKHIVKKTKEKNRKIKYQEPFVGAQ